MPENWSAIAAEVDAALRSVANISQADGFPATLRKAGTGGPVNPWDPPGGTPTYHQVAVLVSDEELRDINGTLIGQVKRTVTISGAAGVVPSKNDKIALGQALEYVDSATDEGITWHSIVSVKPLAPAGVAVLYDLLLSA